MANKHINLDSLFTSIADAIREQSGNTEQIIADNFPEEIKQLKGKGEDVTEELAEQDNIIALMQEAIGNKTAGATEPFAFITVTYPEGSICTCTDGTKTLTAKNTDGTYVFCVPYAATWTVTSTNPEDNTKTKSQDVEIVEEGQFESVTLSYKLYLIQNGVVSEILGSFSNISTTDEAAIYITRSDSSGYGGSTTSNSEKEVDANDYESLKFLAKGKARDQYGGIACTFGGSELKFIPGDETVSEYTEFHLDISAVDTATVQLEVVARNGTSKLYVSDMWLE